MKKQMRGIILISTIILCQKGIKKEICVHQSSPEYVKHSVDCGSLRMKDCPMNNPRKKCIEQARPVEPRLMQVKLDWSSRFQRSRFLENFRALTGLEENLDQTVP